MAGSFTVGALPEGDELKNLLGLLAFAQIGVGVAEDLAVGVLSQKHQHAGLAAAAGRNVVFLDDRILSVVRHRMKIQIEGLSGQEFCSLGLAMPGGQETSRFGVIDSTRIFREIAFFGESIQAGKKRQSFIGNHSHDVAFSLDGPELECQTTAQGLFRRNHL